MPIAAIETRYAGFRFRSRLEARWAVFFDRMQIPWQYEPEGYVIDGRMYLPDFYLPECGTWIEVKGHEGDLDAQFLRAAAAQLPRRRTPAVGVKSEEGPALMLLGPIPKPLRQGDYGWIAFVEDGERDSCRWGFGTYHKNRRPWWLSGDGWPAVVKYGDEPWEYDYDWASPGWLVPTVDPDEWDDAQAAYTAARQARFEHGQSGA